ncbi:MAG: STAS domain-containing protein [Candidatus Lindowbacteria bacterium]|nr:STAS domain-containing protein [Candidatus Lindowbacteria bacterium]
MSETKMMSEGFKITEEASAVCITPMESITDELGREMRSTIISHLDKGGRTFIIDLTQNEILVSIGIGVLAALNTTMASRGARFVVVNNKEFIAKVLEMTRMTEILTLVNTIEEAREKLA